MMPFHLGKNTPAGGFHRLTKMRHPKAGRGQNSCCKNFAAGKAAK